MPTHFALSESDWEHLRTLSITEETLAKLAGKGDPLTRLDWIEICLALMDEREKLADAIPPDQRIANAWLMRLDRMLEALAPICDDIARGKIILKARSRAVAR